MRFSALAVAVSAVALMACGGGDKTNVADTGASTATPDASAGAPTAGAVAALPITGTTHEVQMLGDEKGYRYEPAELTIKQGDGIKFIMVSGAPHNVAFDATIPEAGKAQLNANIPDKMGDMSSKMVMQPNEEILISFAGVAPGKYDFNCTPHLAMNMRGSVTVQ